MNNSIVKRCCQLSALAVTAVSLTACDPRHADDRVGDGAAITEPADGQTSVIGMESAQTPEHETVPTTPIESAAEILPDEPKRPGDGELARPGVPIPMPPASDEENGPRPSTEKSQKMQEAHQHEGLSNQAMPDHDMSGI